jgi:hypothetical protein
MRRYAVLTLAVLVIHMCSLASGGEIGFNLRWNYYLVGGLDDVSVFDMDKDGVVEIYACSYESGKPAMWVFDENGGLLQEIPIPRPGLVDFGNERVVRAIPADFDGNGNLDVLFTTEIIASGMNSHRLYRFERAFQEDLKRYRLLMRWMEVRTGLVTGIAVVDYGWGQEVYASSSDFMIRSFYANNGSLIRNLSLDSSVWDIYPVYVGANRTVFAAAAFKHLYLLNDTYGILWNYSADTRFTRVYESDVDNNSVADIFALSGDVLQRFSIDGWPLWNRTIRDADTNIVSADFNNDGLQEVILGSGQEIVGLNNKGDAAWRLDVGDRPNYIAVYNLSGLSLVVATFNGLKVFDAEDGGEFKVENGSRMLEYAMMKFAAGNRSAALAYAERAKTAFLAAGDIDSAGGCDLLLGRIRTALSADHHYVRALSYMGDGMTQEAVSEAEAALELYSRAGLEGDLNKSVSLNYSLHLILYGKGNLTLADYFYREAESYYVKSDFDAAGLYARNASMYYRLAGDSSGISRSEAIIRSTMDKKTTTTITLLQTGVKMPEERQDYMDYLLEGVLALLFFIIIAVFMSAVRKRA